MTRAFTATDIVAIERELGVSDDLNAHLLHAPRAATTNGAVASEVAHDTP
jgi:hypothetical protein